jgi:hypothetical protein
MTLSNRPSSLLQPDLIIIEYQFLIHSMEKGIRKLQEKFDRDPTVGSKVMAAELCVLQRNFGSLPNCVLCSETLVRCRHCVSCSELAFAAETELSAANL